MNESAEPMAATGPAPVSATTSITPSPLPAARARRMLPDGQGTLRALARIVTQRGAQAVIVAALVSSLGYVMMRVLPGDMAFRVAAGRYGYDMVSAEAAEAVRVELGLSRPWFEGLALWWARLLHGDLGVSTVTGAPVVEEIWHQLGHTLWLACAALAISVAVAVPLGFAAGLRPGKAADRATLLLSVALRALPPFVLGILLVTALSVHFDVLPAGGHGDHGNWIAPALTLALGLSATAMRVSRDAMRGVAASPHFLFARTKGLSDRLAMLRHGLRNAAVPVVAYLGVQLIYLLEGVVVVETLFAWPGIGHALVHAIFGRDVPMIQGTALVMGLLFVGLNAVVDLACAAIDPRVRARRRG